MTNFHETCETVTIQTKNGPVVINKSDFDEKEHKLAKVAKHEEPPIIPPAPAPVIPPASTDTPIIPPASTGTTFVPPADVATRQFFVNKTGKRWFITDDKGAKFEDIGQPENGFDSDGDAGTYVGKLRESANPA